MAFPDIFTSLFTQCEHCLHSFDKKGMLYYLYAKEQIFDHFPNDKFLDCSKFKELADDKINVTEQWKPLGLTLYHTITNVIDPEKEAF